MEILELLQEVKNSKIDLGTIRVSELIGQFLQTHDPEPPDIEEESAALVHFAELLLLKSKRLLPELDQKIKAEEERILAELEELEARAARQSTPVFREAAEKLCELWEKNQKTFPRPSFNQEEDHIVFLEVSPSDLQMAFYEVLERRAKTRQLMVVQKPVIVFSQFLDLVWKMILKDKVLKFSDFKKRFAAKPEIIAAFLALLELARRQKVKLLQETVESELVVERK